jgi:hypothetical protein
MGNAVHGRQVCISRRILLWLSTKGPRKKPCDSAICGRLSFTQKCTGRIKTLQAALPTRPITSLAPRSQPGTVVAKGWTGPPPRRVPYLPRPAYTIACCPGLEHYLDRDRWVGSAPLKTV